MKPAPFTIAPAADLAAAAALLAEDGARAIAGGQSLGPMLNFRAARPDRLVPLSALAGLQGVEDSGTAITIGAATTHAAIADGRIPDLPGNILARIAGGIAYRAVRNRGTIGGSLCHADPAADWLTTLIALDATLLTTTRTISLHGFVTLPYRTILEPGEILRAIRINRPATGFGWGYHKLCRKPGEFAHAMAACLRTEAGTRLVLGALGGPPLLVADAGEAEAALATVPPVERHLHLVAASRALAEAGA
jgi:carbon-monoxide dehydrogenase medium subunit